MTSIEINEKLAKSFVEMEDLAKKLPSFFTPLTSLDKIISYANVCRKFHYAVTECACHDNGIRLMFQFDNVSHASVIKTKYTNYEWEIMSPSIISDYECILAHLDDTAMLETLTKIANGEDIYVDEELYDE